MRREKARRVLDAIESERAREQAEVGQVRAEQARREQNCELARRRVSLLERANIVTRAGDDGERVYLNDEERGEALARARDLMREWCG